MTIVIDTKAIICFTAGVILSDKVKKLTKKMAKKATTKAKTSISNKTANARDQFLKKMHKAVDVAFDPDTIDIPVR